MTQNFQVRLSMNQAAVVKSGLVLKQGDFGMNLEIEVLNFDTSNTTPQIVFRKPMGAVESTSVTKSGNVYTYTIQGTELDTPGKVICDLKLKNSTTQRISTASFSFEVVADTLDGLNEHANSYSDTIGQIWETLQDYSEDSEAWAVGTKAGTPVPSSAEQYHNNAKYYSDLTSGTSNKVLSAKTVDPSYTNINDFIVMGVYTLSSGQAYTNDPVGSNTMRQLFVIANSAGNAKVQVMVEGASGNMYFRAFTSGNWTAWNSEISNIKREISYIYGAAVDTSSVGITAESYVHGGTGAIEGWSGANYSASDNIDISKFVNLKIKARAQYNGTAGVAIYDENGTYLTGANGTSIGKSTSQLQDAVLAVPQNAKYIRISLNPRISNTVSDYPIYCVGSFDVINDAIKAQINPIIGLIDTSQNAFTQSSVIRSDTGELETAAFPYAYIASDFIDISKMDGDVLSLYCTINGTAGAAFYDFRKTFISGYGASDVPSQGTTPQKCSITIPSGAVYIRFTGLGTFSTTFGKYQLMIKDTNIMRSRNEAIKKAAEVIKGFVDTSENTFFEKSIIKADDGQMQTYQAFPHPYLASDFIPIAGLAGKYINFMCTINGTSGAAFYKFDKTYISGYGASDVPSQGTAPQECTALVPDDAVYFRFTGMGSYSTDFSDYIIKINNDVTLLELSKELTKLADENLEEIKAIEEKNLGYSSLSIFEHFGVIGDSYASGEIVVGGHYEDYYNLSWGQNIARMCGTSCINFSKGGLTTKTWLTDEHGLPLLQSSSAQQLYLVCLGLNDQTAIGQGTEILGTIEDVKEDYTQNPDTFYGNYGRIIGNIKTKAPNAKIIICSVTEGTPGDFARVNPGIKEIAEYLSLPYINLQDDPFFTSKFYKNTLVANHPIAVTYGGYAMGVMRLFSQCAIKYSNYFKDYIG